MGLSKEEFEQIKNATKKSWLGEYEDTFAPGRSSQFSTSYKSAFHTKDDELIKKQVARPTSPTRRNNPHPTRKFLSTRVKSPRSDMPPRIAHDSIKITTEPLMCAKPMVHSPCQPYVSYRGMYDPKALPKQRSKSAPVPNPRRTAAYNVLSRSGPFIDEDNRPTSAQVHDAIRRVPRQQASLHRYLKPVGVKEYQFASEVHHNVGTDPYHSGTADRKYTGKQPTDRYILKRYGDEKEDGGRGSRRQDPRIAPLRFEFKHHPEWLP